MKKFALFAFAMLCVSAAQAVTIDWTLKIGGTNPDNEAQSGFGPGWVGLFCLSGSVDDITKTYISVSGNDYTLKNDLASGTKIAVKDGLNYAELSNQKDQMVTLNFSTTVVDTTSVTFVLFNDWNMKKNAGGYALLTVTDIDPNATELKLDLSDETFEWTKNKVNTYEASAVPEPTALALLALGVAGVVLRRKKLVA